MPHFIADLRCFARTLTRSAWFTLLAVVTPGLAIGGTLSFAFWRQHLGSFLSRTP
jgi:hypothetical protein